MAGNIFGYTWGMRFKVFGLTLLIIGIFMGAGYLADQVFHTQPKLMVAGLLISFPFNQIITAKILKKILESKKQKILDKP